MNLGIVDGRDMIAVPNPPRRFFNQLGQAPGDVVGAPGAVLGERLHGFPVGGAIQGQNGLGDGVLLDVDGHGGDPLEEATISAAAERAGERSQQGLPD